MVDLLSFFVIGFVSGVLLCIGFSLSKFQSLSKMIDNRAKKKEERRLKDLDRYYRQRKRLILCRFTQDKRYPKLVHTLDSVTDRVIRGQTVTINWPEGCPPESFVNLFGALSDRIQSDLDHSKIVNESIDLYEKG